MPALAKTMAMPPPMVPAPITAAVFTGMAWCLWERQGFCDFALAEENMDQGFGLIGEEAVDEKFLLELAAFFERQLGGGFDGIDGG